MAARSSSFQILEFFKTLPEYSQMKESFNVEGLRPVDIVNEKEDTEVKSKLLGMSSLIYRANIKDTIVSSFWTSDLWFLR